MSGLEIISVIISIIAVILTIKRKIWCWFFNFLACVLYAVLFFQFKLYGETILQAFFMVMAIYGYIQWKNGLAEQHVLSITDLSLLKKIQQIVLSCVLGIGFGAILANFTEASVPWLDAQLAAFSLLATYWSSQKYLSTWRLWVVVDIIYVAMFIYKDLYLTAGLYAVFVMLAALGWIQWSKIYAKQNKTVIMNAS